MSIRYAYTLGLLLSCCAAPEFVRAPTPPPRDLAGERTLASISAEREAAEAKLSAVAEHDRERCEFRVGDCKILVDEQREGLMTSEQLDHCKVMADQAAVTGCLADELVKRHKQAALADFYSNEVSCMKTVIACTDQLDQDARSAVVEQRAGERERAMHRTKRGATAMNAMAAVENKVTYLRATLPPSASKACPATDDMDQCTKEANDYEDRFQAELEKDVFNADAGLALLEQAAKRRAQCSQPELACLTKTLESHGLYPEAKKWVTRNFEALDRRERAGGALTAGVKTKCINDASRTHQAQIVDAYVKYAHESVLFFRVQLDKAFLAMHEAQAACMTVHQPRHASAQANLTSE